MQMLESSLMRRRLDHLSADLVGSFSLQMVQDLSHRILSSLQHLVSFGPCFWPMLQQLHHMEETFSSDCCDCRQMGCGLALALGMADGMHRLASPATEVDLLVNRIQPPESGMDTGLPSVIIYPGTVPCMAQSTSGRLDTLSPS